MIRLKLIDKNTFYDQGDRIKLKPNDQYTSTKTLFGYDSWYYEATCYSGNEYALFGFITDDGNIDFYPFGGSNCVLLQNGLKTEYSNTQQIIYTPYKVTIPYTIGVGIDTIHNTFTVFYNDAFFTVEFNQSAKIMNINAYIWGANYYMTDEEVSVNFGEYPFKYSVSDLIPWKKHKIIQTCSSNVYLPKTIFIISFIFQ